MGPEFQSFRTLQANPFAFQVSGRFTVISNTSWLGVIPWLFRTDKEAPPTSNKATPSAEPAKQAADDLSPTLKGTRYHEGQCSCFECEGCPPASVDIVVTALIHPGGHFWLLNTKLLPLLLSVNYNKCLPLEFVWLITLAMSFCFSRAATLSMFPSQQALVSSSTPPFSIRASQTRQKKGEGATKTNFQLFINNKLNDFDDPTWRVQY